MKNINEKKCSKCGEIKPVSEYYIDRSKKISLSSRCKECIREYRKENIVRVNGEIYNINTAPEELKPVLKKLIEVRKTKNIKKEILKKINNGDR